MRRLSDSQLNALIWLIVENCQNKIFGRAHAGRSLSKVDAKRTSDFWECVRTNLPVESSKCVKEVFLKAVGNEPQDESVHKLSEYILECAKKLNDDKTSGILSI